MVFDEKSGKEIEVDVEIIDDEAGYSTDDDMNNDNYCDYNSHDEHDEDETSKNHNSTSTANNSDQDNLGCSPGTGSAGSRRGKMKQYNYAKKKNIKKKKKYEDNEEAFNDRVSVSVCSATNPMGHAMTPKVVDKSKSKTGSALYHQK